MLHAKKIPTSFLRKNYYKHSGHNGIQLEMLTRNKMTYLLQIFKPSIKQVLVKIEKYNIKSKK